MALSFYSKQHMISERRESSWFGSHRSNVGPFFSSKDQISFLCCDPHPVWDLQQILTKKGLKAPGNKTTHLERIYPSNN